MAHTPKRSLLRRGSILQLFVVFSMVFGQLLLMTPGVALAAGFTVNSTADAVDANTGDGVCQTATPGECTLRAAIQEANVLAGADTITLPAGTYTLSIAGAGEDLAATGDLDVTEALEIIGAGAGTTIIDGADLDRVFDLRITAAVSLSQLTVQNGNATDSGGGILSIANLTLDTVTLSSNTTAIGGGGLYASGGSLTMTQSTVDGNTAPVSGNSGGGALIRVPNDITFTTFSNNSAAYAGGGAYFQDFAATITDSQFINNSNAFAYGGGLYTTTTGAIVTRTLFQGNQGVFGGGAFFNNTGTVIDSTFINNSAILGGWVGGAWFQGAANVSGTTFSGNNGNSSAGGARFGGTTTVDRASFIGNTASNGGGAYFLGANTKTLTNVLFDNNGATQGNAIYVEAAAPLTVRHTTIAAPTTKTGAAIYVQAGTVSVQNSIIAAYATGINNAGGTVSQNYNLFNTTTTSSGTISGGANSLSGNPQFVNQAGGDYHLTSASPALDVATNLGVTTDLDGTTRPQGFGSDIGAYEGVAFLVNSTADAVDSNPGDGICATAGAVCTLRAAIQEANALAGANRIALPAGTYTLSIAGREENAAATGDLDITGDLTIAGTGASSTIIQAGTTSSNGVDRAFDVKSGASVSFRDLSIRYGNGSDQTPGTDGGNGGAIANAGNLTLTRVDLNNNWAPNGGAINNVGTALIDSSVVRSNASNNSAGGIRSAGGSLTLRNSTVSGNRTVWAGGGAMAGSGALVIEYSTIVDNTQSNTVTNKRGGIFWTGAGSTVSITGSILARNYDGGNSGNGTPPALGNLWLSGPVMTSFGYNLTDSIGAPNLVGSGMTVNGGGSFAGFVAAGDQQIATANLGIGTLADNGGPTFTHALIGFSPAINGGGSGCAAIDQRGTARPQGPACDAGAFERVAYTVTSTGDAVDANPGDNICETATPGECTLRAAIAEANAHAGADMIAFNIPGGGVQTITPATALPSLSETVLIDGLSQAGASCAAWPPTLQIELDGSLAGNVLGLDTSISGGHQIRGLVINRFSVGIHVANSSNNSIECNFIGSEPDGNTAAPNNYGILIQQDSVGNRIGGPATSQRNLLAGNNLVQIFVVNYGSAPNNTLIENNYIGTNASGSGDFDGNSSHGIQTFGATNTIIRNNLLSANQGGYGIELGGDVARPTDGTIIQGNLIGTDVSGNAALPNAGGISLGTSGNTSVQNTLIGTDGDGNNDAAERNIISGNIIGGIVLSGSQVTNNQIQGNYIGPNSAGNTGLGGTQHGIQLSNGASNNTVGSEVTPNQIAFNGGAGINVTGSAGSGNAFRANSIHSNGALAIDLGGNGVTFNHVGTITGPNNYQNYPVLSLATSDGTTLRVGGSLAALPDVTYAIDIYSNPTCDATSFGQGRTYLGSFDVITDGNGNVIFDRILAAGVLEPHGISAVASGPAGSSEFSYCRPVATPNLNWVMAQPVATSSQTSQYITDLLQEKWFRFPVQSGDMVRVTLNSLPGSAVSLHSDPNPIYNGLTNPSSAAVLSAAAADIAFLPSGSLPSGSLPSGSLPSGSLPSGSLPSGSLDSYFLPSGSLPSGSLPSGSLPSGSLPSGSLPSGSLPSGSLPSGSLPSGSLPSGSLPSGSLPSGSLPSGSLPSGSLDTSYLPSGSLPSGSLPSGSLPSGSLPSGSLDGYASAARRSLLGIAADPFAVSQTIERKVFDLQEDLYVRVVGPYSLSGSFSLDVQVLGGTCSALQSMPNNLNVIAGAQPSATNLRSLLLTDSGRMHGSSSEIATALADLQTLAGRSDVAGAVIDLADARYERVAWANTQADQNPTCPSAKNTVAGEIKAVIDAYRAVNPDLAYIVLAGGADVIPFYQVQDVSGLANEREYLPPVAPLSPSEAGLRVGLVKGQDFYGSAAEITVGGHTLALPGLAVGRLVENAADISTVIAGYIATNGVVTPRSSLVTGYDFVGDAAEAVEIELNAGTASRADTLIQPVGEPPTGPNAWTADQLREKLLAGNFDVAMLSGHFSAGNLLAADYRTTLSAAEIAASSADLNNALIMALGCHGGFSLPSSDLLADASPNPDWAKAFLRKGVAGFVAATGYAYGDTELTEYGERLFLELNRQLRTGNDPVSLGYALMEAKRIYLAETAQMTGIDEKTIVEMTLYGLPMMKINMPGQRILPRVEAPVVTAIAPESNGPGASYELGSTVVTLAPATSEVTKTLSDLNSGTTIMASYLTGEDGVVANPFEPIYPKAIYDVTLDGSILRGVAFRGGSYSDESGVVPLSTAPAIETSTPHSSFYTEVFYPNQLWMPNFYDTFTDGTTRLIAFPAQFQSSAPGAIDGTRRTFDDLNLKLYYLPEDWPANGTPELKAAAISAAPVIQGASGDDLGGSIGFRVNAVAEGSAGVQAVWVLYTGKPGTPYYGEWRPLDLTQDGIDQTLWQGTLPLISGSAGDILFMVQAVGGAGLTTLATNLGAYYSITSALGTPTAQPVDTILRVSGPSSGAYLQEQSFQVQLSTSGGTPLSGELVAIDIGGQQAAAVTDASGAATITLKLRVAPGSYSLQARFRGNSSYNASFNTNSFTLAKEITSVTLSPNSATIGINPNLAAQPTDLTAEVRDSTGRALSGKSLVFVLSGPRQTLVRSVIADYTGAARLGMVNLLPDSYNVAVYFSGEIPLGNGESLTLDDPNYTASSLLNGTLIVNDLNAPSISASATTADAATYSPNTWTNQEVTVTFTCGDADSGIAQCSPDQTFSGTGNYTASGSAVDNGGNSSTTTFGPIRIDTAAPTLSPVVAPSTVLLGGSATVTANASDANSGLASVVCDTPNTSAAGNFTLNCTATDNAGNSASATANYSVFVDTTAPVISVNVGGTAGTNGWYTGNVVIDWTVGDPESGVSGISGCVDMTISTDTAGATFTCTANSAGGSSSESVTIKRDATAPGLNPVVTPSSVDVGDPATLNSGASDATSGLASVGCDPIDTSVTGSFTVNCTATDNAGNSTNAATNYQVVGGDATPPVVTAQIAGTLGTNNWYTSDVTLNWAVSDPESSISGMSGCQSLTITNDTTGATFTCTATSDGGSTTESVTIKRDATAPELAPTLPSTLIFLNAAVPTVTANASDATAGLVDVTCGTVTTNSVGPKTVTCTARDNAGNTVSVNLNYRVIYKFSGFLQPINDSAYPGVCGVPCSTSIFRAGSTVPAKFELRDANGVIIQAAGAPIWLTPQQGTTVTGIVDESVYSDPATSGSYFRWSEPQYIYNWKTPKELVGFYYRIGVRFDDGQTYYVTIGLR